MHFLGAAGSEDINLDETSLTVQYGDDLEQDRPYEFSGTFYDITNDTREWTEDCYLETQFSGFNGEVISNDTITDLNNKEVKTLSNDSIVVSEGSVVQNGTLDQVDGDCLVVNSTDDNMVEVTDFTVMEGTLGSAGNLTEIDGDYSTYLSIYEIDVPDYEDFVVNEGILYQNGTDLENIDGDYMILNASIPEAGHYPGTFSFTDDIVGEDPLNFTLVETNGDIYVVDELLNHKMIAYMDDDGGATYMELTQEFNSSQVSGSIDFWYLTPDNTKTCDALIRDGTNVGPGLRITAGKFQYLDYLGFHDLGLSCNNDQWYHIRIDFECDSGSYMGLPADRYYIRIDGVEYGYYAFYVGTSDLDNIRWSTDGGSISELYIDAIGYYWDTNYTLGDNWYWNYYLGNYTFEDEATETSGTDIDYVDYYNNLANTEIRITGEDNEHKKVLEMYDNNAGGYYLIYENFDSQESGTMEFWLKTTDITKKTQFTLSDGTDRSWFYIQSSKFQYYDGTVKNVPNVEDPVNDVWYHVQWNFECGSGGYMGLGADKMSLVINDVSSGQLNFYSGSSVISRVTISSHGTSTGYYSYLDSVSYSWDENYTLGDNTRTYYYSSISFTTTYQLDIDLRDLSLFYSSKTDVLQTIEISLYNFDTTTFDVINDSISLDFTEDSFPLNSSYYNATNYIMINFYGLNLTEDFHLYLEMLFVKNSPILNLTTTINCDLLDNLVYSFKTNITQLIELYIYNFTSSSYELVDNSSYSSFNLNFTTISPDFHNGTSIKLMFYAINSSYEDFEFYLEVLKVVNITTLDFILYAEGFEYLTNLLNLGVSSWYNATSSLMLINFSIYDFEVDSWISINSSFSADFICETTYNNNSVDLMDLVNTSGNNEVLFRFQATNNFEEFDLSLDCLNVTIHRKLTLSYTKTFTLLGTWRYRFYIPEDGYVSDWYYFDVVEHADNFMAISESPYITKWVLINNETEISTSRRFLDDMTGSNVWTLMTETDYILTFQMTPNATYVLSSAPSTNYGSSVWLYDSYWSGAWYWEYYSCNYVNNDDYYYDAPAETHGYISCARNWLGGDILRTDNVYTVESFDENTVTWSSQPATVAYVSSLTRSFSGTWYNFDIGITAPEYISIRYETASSSHIRIYSDDAGSNKPIMNYFFNKSYSNNAGGYWYMQTDETETLTMRSSEFIDVSLLAGDFFTIQCEGNVENIDLQLLFEGTVVDTISVFQDNVNSETQLIEVSVDDDVTFDQIQFTGLFNEAEKFKCYALIADGYDTTTRQQTTTTYIAPEESGSLLLSTGIHQLKIYDNDILRVNKWINITHSILDNLEVYTPIYIITCRLTLIDQDNVLLDFELFEIYATRTLSNTTNRISILSEYFQADTGTTIEFEFYDRFGDHIKNEVVEVDPFIFIELTIYSLKIKNDASNYSNLIITKSGSSIEIEDILAPDELYEYKLIEGNYTVEWLNNENGILTNYSIELMSDYVLTLPTSYLQVYFAAFLSNGLGLDYSTLRFYINDSRRDFGFNTITSDYINITILDYFNQTAYTEIISVIGINEYNIYISLKSLKIQNRATELVNYTLLRGTIEHSGYILSEEIIEFQVVSGIYNISYTNHENMDTSTFNINLTSNKLFIINTTYFNIYFSIFNYDGLGLDHDLFRFYVNDERKDFGFNTLVQDVNNLKVLDYFNATLFNRDVDLSGFTEYNIIVEVYTLILNNEYNRSVEMHISRYGIEIVQVIPSRSGLSYRFLPNVTYELEVYEIENNTLLYETEIELNTNNKIVSFGFYSAEVPFDPTPIAVTYMTYFWFAIFMIAMAGILGVITFRLWYNSWKRKVGLGPKVIYKSPTTRTRTLLD